MKAKTIEELRNKFFEECVSENTGGYKIINYAAHDLFEWIKENIIQPEPIISEPKQVTEGMIEKMALEHSQEYKFLTSETQNQKRLSYHLGIRKGLSLQNKEEL